MRIIKRYLLIIISVLTITSMVLSGGYLKNQVKNYTVGISDLQGDRANLQDIKISGTVADSLHNQKFKIINGNVKTYFSEITKEEREKLYSTPLTEKFDYINYSYDPFEIPTEPKNITTNKATINIEIGLKNYSRFSTISNMIIKSEKDGYSFIYENIGGKIHKSSCSFSFYDMPAEDVLSSIRVNAKTDKIYFFTKTGHDCVGFGGAYDITEQIKKSYKDDERIDLENIAPINLKDGSIRIIDMQITGDKMLFVTFENGEVVLKPYNLSNNSFLDDINLGSYKFADKSWGSFKYHSTSDDRYIITSFEMNDTDVYKDDNRLFTAVYDTEANKIVFKNTDEYRELPFGLFFVNVTMKYKNDKLFLVRDYSIYKSGQNVNDHELRITALSNCGTLYEGVINSSVSDDRHFSENNQLQTALQYREYFNLALE